MSSRERQLARKHLQSLVYPSNRTTLMLTASVFSAPARVANIKRYASAPRADSIPPRSTISSSFQPRSLSRPAVSALASALFPDRNTELGPILLGLVINVIEAVFID